MEYLFSDLREHEDKTLFIIGNGFDRFHDIPSSYSHFHHWLLCQGKDKENFVNGLERTFSKEMGNKNLLWMDFEKALGEYNFEEVFKQYTDGMSGFYDEEMATTASHTVSSLVEEIGPFLKEWIISVNDKLTECKPMLQLTKESKYLSFNYTETLEKVYNIPSKNICHIHGTCTKEDKLIFGHNHLVNERIIEDEGYDSFEERGRISLTKVFNSLYKNVVSICSSNQSFFDLVKDFDRVVVLGHSLSEIDLKYFFRIANLVSKEAHWHFSKFSPQDEESISSFVDKAEKLGCLEKKNRWMFNL